MSPLKPAYTAINYLLIALCSLEIPFRILTVLSGGYFFSPLVASPLAAGVTAYVVIDQSTKTVVMQRAATQKIAPYSITKIATAWYFLSTWDAPLTQMLRAHKDALVAIPPRQYQQEKAGRPLYWMQQRSSHIGLKVGEILTAQALLEGMLIASGNDAANCLAHAGGKGSIPTFMQKMNRALYQLGARNTHFVNPHGSVHSQHSTTALDMALISCAAMQDARLRAIVKKRSFQRPKTNKQQATAFRQTNRLLRPGKEYYRYATGMKTGHWYDRYNLVASASYKGRDLIAVVIGGKTPQSVCQCAKALFERAYKEQQKIYHLLPKGVQAFRYQGSWFGHAVRLQEGLSIALYPSEQRDLMPVKVVWGVVNGTIRRGQKVGEVHLKNKQGVILKRCDLFAC